MFKSTIDSIVGDISKKVSQLRTLAGEHHNNSLIHNEEAIRHQDIANEQILQRDRAVRIADKFSELLS